MGSINERAVDSLQEIYAVVIALAMAQAIESLLRDPVSGTLLDWNQVISWTACIHSNSGNARAFLARNEPTSRSLLCGKEE